jgi:hypothetical protein
MAHPPPQRRTLAARPILSGAPATRLDGMAVIEVHELHKRYGETVALGGGELRRAGR